MSRQKKHIAIKRAVSHHMTSFKPNSSNNKKKKILPDSLILEIEKNCVSDPEISMVTDVCEILSTTLSTIEKDNKPKNFSPDISSDSEYSIPSHHDCYKLNNAGTVSKTTNEKEYGWKNFDHDYFSYSECNQHSDSEFDIQSDSSTVPTSFLECNKLKQTSAISLNQKISSWALDYNITHTALNNLLKILKPHHPTLPLDARTLLNTSRKSEYIIIKDINDRSGEFKYFGITDKLVKFLGIFKEFNDDIYLNFNVDGIPIHKSTSKQFWPILCTINLLNCAKSKPLVIAIFAGTSKPNLEDYLRDFIREVSHLISNGLSIDSKNYTVKIKAFVADTPARSYLKCVKGHNGYYSCEKCEIKGKQFLNRMTFTDLTAPKRTDASFANQTQKQHHTGISPLQSLNIGMVTLFPLDYMHLVCLGVTKKLILIW